MNTSVPRTAAPPRLQHPKAALALLSLSQLLIALDATIVFVAHANDPVLARAIQKVKRHVLPLFVIMFIVNYIDRVNIGFVRSHMEHDLGIGAAAYGFGAGLFFIGYALFEVPSNMLLQKVGARIWLTRIMFTWGITATLMAFIQNETHFYILRFLLGVAEAGFFPGVIYYFTRWLPGAERGKAIAIFLSGSALASLISGPLSGLLLQITGMGLHGWQWMYIIEGMASVVLCVFVWFWLDSKPHDAKWLSLAEQDALVNEIDREQRERDAANTVKPTLGMLLKDRQIMLLDGDGVQLRAPAAGIDHALDQRWQPFAFSGDVALDCTLLGGTSTDFNVMTRRDAWVAKVMVVSAEQTSKANYLTPAGLCMVLDGSWSCAETGDTLHSGQGVWWTQEQMLTLAPQEPQARLVFVGIAPK